MRHTPRARLLTLHWPFTFSKFLPRLSRQLIQCLLNRRLMAPCQIPPLNSPPTTPTNPALLPRCPSKTTQERHTNEPRAGTPTRNPTSLRIKPITNCRPHQLTTEDRDHVC